MDLTRYQFELEPNVYMHAIMYVCSLCVYCMYVCHVVCVVVVVVASTEGEDHTYASISSIGE